MKKIILWLILATISFGTALGDFIIGNHFMGWWMVFAMLFSLYCLYGSVCRLFTNREIEAYYDFLQPSFSLGRAKEICQEAGIK